MGRGSHQEDRTGQGTLEAVQDGSRVMRGGPGQVGGPSRRSETGWGTIERSGTGWGTLGERRTNWGNLWETRTGWGTLGEVRDGSVDR